MMCFLTYLSQCQSDCTLKVSILVWIWEKCVCFESIYFCKDGNWRNSSKINDFIAFFASDFRLRFRLNRPVFRVLKPIAKKLDIFGTAHFQPVCHSLHSVQAYFTYVVFIRWNVRKMSVLSGSSQTPKIANIPNVKSL